MNRGEQPLITVRGLSKSFGKSQVLQDVSFDLYPGEVIGFIGPSGSGKSVFLKTLLGFLKPDRGTIQKTSGVITGFSLQENPLYSYLTVEQNLQYFAKINAIKQADRRFRIDHLLKELNITTYQHTLFKNLSGGTKKRVDLACSLLENPNVLILDEPFLGLDPTLVQQLSTFIKHLQQNGITIIISSHRLEELKKICTRFIQLNNKHITPYNQPTLQGRQYL